MPTPETVIETEILDWLVTLEKCTAVKLYNGAGRGTKKRNTKHRPLGIPDIVGVYDSRFFAIEVKAGYNKPSDHQIKFIERILDCGGVALWTSSIDDCKASFNFHFGKPRIESYRIPNELLLFQE